MGAPLRVAASGIKVGTINLRIRNDYRSWCSTTTTRMTRYFISVPSMLIFSTRPFSFFPIFFPPIFLIFIFLFLSAHLFLILITLSSSSSSSSPCLPLLPLHPIFFTVSSSSPCVPVHHVFLFTMCFSSSCLLPLHLFTPSSPHLLPLHPVFLLSEHLYLLTFLRFSDPNVLAHGIKVFLLSPYTRCNLKNIRSCPRRDCPDNERTQDSRVNRTEGDLWSMDGRCYRATS